MKSINEFMLAASEEIVTNAARKSGQGALYSSDIARFLVGLSPRDRVLLIDSINNEERLANLEWSRLIEQRRSELEHASGIIEVLKNEFEEVAE